MRTLATLAVCLLLALPLSLEAQGTAKPFTNVELTQGQLATAFRNNVKSILNADCMVIAQSAERMVGIRISDCDALGDVVEEAEVRDCPAEAHHFANIIRGGTMIGRVGTPRECRPGEKLLYRDNTPFMSLQCGNWVLDQPLPRWQPVPLLGVQAQAPRPLVTRTDTLYLPSPAPQPIPAQPQVVTRERNGFPWGWVALSMAAAGTGWLVACQEFDKACPGKKTTIIRVKIRNNSLLGLALSF